MAQQPKTAIIIVNWNGLKDTLECLDSLLKITGPEYKVFVVDNGSNDGSYQTLSEKFKDNPKVEILDAQKNLGFAGGNNLALKKALEEKTGKFDYFLLLNNDTIVPPSFLGELVDVASRNQNIGIIAPKIYFYSKEKRIWFVGGRINWLKNRGEHDHYNETDIGQFDEHPFFETGFVTGCAMLIKRSVIEKIGLMDERYFLYYEDADWNLAAGRAGYKIAIAPRSFIFHKVSQSTKPASFSYVYYHTRNGAMMAKKYGSPLSVAALHFFNVWIFAKQILKLLIPSKRMWAEAVLKGLFDFYGGVTGELKEETEKRIKN
jgi:hypothetical protein